MPFLPSTALESRSRSAPLRSLRRPLLPREPGRRAVPRPEHTNETPKGDPAAEDRKRAATPHLGASRSRTPVDSSVLEPMAANTIAEAHDFVVDVTPL
jgi:hypothetical protein